MNRVNFLASCATLVVSAAFGLAIGAGPSLAQQGEGELEEIVVIEAKRMVRHEVGRSTIGAPIELIQLIRRVSYADLDLSRPTDVAELETRVHATAEEACARLADMYPLVAPDNPDCVSLAVSGAMEEVQAVVAATD